MHHSGGSKLNTNNSVDNQNNLTDSGRAEVFSSSCHKAALALNTSLPISSAKNKLLAGSGRGSHHAQVLTSRVHSRSKLSHSYAAELLKKTKKNTHLRNKGTTNHH